MEVLEASMEVVEASVKVLLMEFSMDFHGKNSRAEDRTRYVLCGRWN